VLGTSFPHKQQTHLFTAAEISSSNLVTDIRIYKQEISGGNTSEATARASSSSRRKFSARFKLSGGVPSSSGLCLFTILLNKVGLLLFFPAATGDSCEINSGSKGGIGGGPAGSSTLCSLGSIPGLKRRGGGRGKDILEERIG
jgi:hypothetical protein